MYGKFHWIFFIYLNHSHYNTISHLSYSIYNLQSYLQQINNFILAKCSPYWKGPVYPHQRGIPTVVLSVGKEILNNSFHPPFPYRVFYRTTRRLAFRSRHHQVQGCALIEVIKFRANYSETSIFINDRARTLLIKWFAGGITKLKLESGQASTNHTSRSQ